jgi:FKBP-type peptidyl-prolyl cis-trans isomerase FklB
MKISSKVAIIAFAIYITSAFNVQGQTLKTTLDSLSYAIGINVGDNLRNQKLNVNPDIISKAIKDAIANNKNVMSSEACGTFIQNYFQDQASKAGNENRMKGEAFLTTNKTKPGVSITASGLQYKVLTSGTGPKPTETDKVKVHYHGTFIDGTVFDSSVNRGEPATFGVTQVIKGWVEALQLMTVGSKWTLYIPADLAYGPQGPPSIGPNQALVFDVELIEIVK